MCKWIAGRVEENTSYRFKVNWKWIEIQYCFLILLLFKLFKINWNYKKSPLRKKLKENTYDFYQ